MRKRARKEEDCVSLKYLQEVHEVHDEWLYKQTLFPVPAPVITLDADQDLEVMFEQFETCKNRIFDNQKYADTIRAPSPCTPTKNNVVAVASD